MRKTGIIIPALLSALYSQAQMDCQQAARSLAAELLKTSSGKVQLTGKQHSVFHQLTDSVAGEAKTITDQAACFTLLTTLVQPLKDNHLFFSEKVDTLINTALFTDSNWIKSYQASAAFINFPSIAINLDSLEQELMKKDIASPEGIYYQERYQKIGLFKFPGNDTLTGVVLETYLPNWKPGHRLLQLWEEERGRYVTVFINLGQKTMEYYRHIRFVNQAIPLLSLTKHLSGTNYVDIPAQTPRFHFKRIDSETDYMRLGSFAVNNIITPQAKSFLALLNDSLKGKNIIVDLRNNGGGGFVTSRRFIKLLKKKARQHKVLLLMNYNTVSNAEQVAIRLKNRKNVHTLGQATRGMITYGNNSGIHKPIAGSSFRLYITDMKGVARDLKYEDTGVTPQVLLDISSDWLEQTRKYISQLP